MQIVNLNHEVTFENEELGVKVALPPHCFHVIPEYMAKDIREQANYGPKLYSKLKDLYLEYNKYAGQPLTNQIVVFIREGGIGDIMFLTPFIKQIKENYPNCKVAVCCSEKIIPILRYTETIDYMIPYPLNLKNLQILTQVPLNRSSYYFFSFEKLIEEGEKASVTNIYDLLEEELKVKIEEKRPCLTVPYHADFSEKDERKFKALEGDLIIGLQVSASSGVRAWKPGYIVEFLNSWIIPDTTFVLLDSPARQDYVKERIIRKVKNDNINILDLSSIENPSLLKSAAWVLSCDMLLGPDSSMAHIVSMNEIPMVCLFGAFHSNLRVLTYKNVLALNAMPDCEFAKGIYKVCLYHGSSCPRAQQVNRNFSPCMDLLTPKTVLAACYYWIDKKVKKVSIEEVNIPDDICSLMEKFNDGPLQASSSARQ